MRFVAVLAMLAFALSGCSGGGTLLMTPADLGAGFAYADLEDEEWSFFAEIFNMSSNPGRADTEGFEDDEGVELKALQLAIIEFNGTGDAVFSAVFTFHNATAADAWYQETLDCSEAEDEGFYTYRTGARVVLHDGEEITGEAAAQFASAIVRYEDRTGLSNPCS